jgi:hypothetical protein
MSVKSQSFEHPALSAAVENCLPKLHAVALSLDTYGSAAEAAKLHEVIEDLKRASPNGAFPFAGPMEFVVNGTFKVTRQQAANTLWYAFTGEISWFRIVDTLAPRELRFRSIDQTNPGIVDYPLNEGGVVRLLISAGSSPRIFELRLDVIAHGIEVLASRYPRHFADLINENGDLITADVLVQCCLFGDVVYG